MPGGDPKAVRRQNRMLMPKIAFGFTGCKLNRYEIQAVSEALETAGFEIVPFDQNADCYVINTCSVTGNADLSSRQLIRKSRRRSPGSRILVTGCYADLKPAEVAEIGADLVVPNLEKESIPSKILEMFRLNNPNDTTDNEFSSVIVSKMGSLTRGFVKIQEGCDRACAYCTIWMSRGPVRSRNSELIIREINALHQNGYKEIVLTGVHIGRYLYSHLNLTGLLKKILDETAIERVRLSSLYPTEIDDRLIGLLALNPRICPHVHLSIQSGDDEILRAMGRKYSRLELEEIVRQFKDAVPDITIGADIIVGFPGETETNFENSCSLIRESAINHLHVFRFSARPNTRAADMPDQIQPGEKERRTKVLRGIGRSIKRNRLTSFIGKELRVLFENRADSDSGELTGLSENYLRVNAFGTDKLKNQIVRVRPSRVKDSGLFAEILN